MAGQNYPRIACPWRLANSSFLEMGPILLSPYKHLLALFPALGASLDLPKAVFYYVFFHFILIATAEALFVIVA
jgi:hypothetical protein